MTADLPDFAAEAERHRQNGDADAARRIAEAGLQKIAEAGLQSTAEAGLQGTAEAGLAEAPIEARGRIALALALIDLGDVARAHRELAAALVAGSKIVDPLAGLAVVPDSSFDGTLADDELERAVAEAESRPEEMMDANRVVEQALRAAELDSPEMDFDVTSHPTYATESMASLLDEQGRRAEASALRETLSANAASDSGLHAASAIPIAYADSSGWEEAGVGPDHAKRLRVVATLEGWLHNLRRQSAGGAA